MNENAIQRVNILGVRICAVTMAQTLKIMCDWISRRQAHYVCCVPAHAIMDCVENPSLRHAFNFSGLTTPDGMSIVWLLRLAGYTVERVYGPDLLLATAALSVEKGYRHYFYGGAPGVTEKLVTRLKQRFPGLQVVGFESPPFHTLSPEEDKAVVERIRNVSPDFLWVGIGSPRQECWMSEHVNVLGVPVLVGIGAAFDFLSGNKPQAPRWIQRMGLEWLFRLISEPKRLWRRYVLGYPKFIFLVLLQQLGLKSFE